MTSTDELRAIARREEACTGTDFHHGVHEALNEAAGELDALRARLDECEEQIASISAGCYDLPREDLIQRITAVGPERWKAGAWITQREAPLRAERDRLATLLDLVHDEALGDDPFHQGQLRAFLDDHGYGEAPA